MANKSFWPLICFLVLLAFLMGCGGGSSSTPPTTVPAAKPEFLYLGTIPDGPGPLITALSTYKVDTTTGALSLTSTVPRSQAAMNIVADPASKFLYISDPRLPATTIDTFSIDPATGALTSNAQFALPAPPCSPLTSFCEILLNVSGLVAIAPNGKEIFYANGIQDPPAMAVGALTIDGTGTLSNVPGSPFPTDQPPFAVLVHPSGKFVYTQNLDSTGGFLNLKGISGYSIGSNGVLTPLAQSPFATPISASLGVLVAHPSGKFFYMTNQFNTNGILAWNVDTTTGNLSALSGSPFMPGFYFGNATLHPSGKFLYATSGGAPGVTAFSIDPTTGALTQLGNSPFAATTSFTYTQVDPSGKFLFAVDWVGDTIIGFTIDSATGALTKLANSTSVGAHVASMNIVKVP